MLPQPMEVIAIASDNSSVGDGEEAAERFDCRSERSDDAFLSGILNSDYGDSGDDSVSSGSDGERATGALESDASSPTGESVPARSHASPRGNVDEGQETIYLLDSSTDSDSDISPEALRPKWLPPSTGQAQPRTARTAGSPLRSAQGAQPGGGRQATLFESGFAVVARDRLARESELSGHCDAGGASSGGNDAGAVPSDSLEDGLAFLQFNHFQKAKREGSLVEVLNRGDKSAGCRPSTSATYLSELSWPAAAGPLLARFPFLLLQFLSQISAIDTLSHPLVVIHVLSLEGLLPCENSRRNPARRL